MGIASRYITKTVVAYISLVLLFLLGLQIFVEFIHEFPKIGTGNYGLYQALIYISLMLPNDVYQLFPMASILGAVMALGLLASHSELIVMRASGMSIASIAAAVVRGAIVLILLMWYVGEVVSPVAQRKAAIMKSSAISAGKVLLTKQGVWLYNDRSFINIKTVADDGKMTGITGYQFADGIKLQNAMRAETGVHHNDSWQLNNVKKTTFDPEKVIRTTEPQEKWDLKISPKIVGAVHIDIDQETLAELHTYIMHRKDSKLETAKYEVDFWQRILNPFATLVMVLLAVPFVFGPLRSSSTGLRMLVGVIAGFGFYILHQLTEPISVVYQVPPLLSAILPIIIFGVFGVVLLFRIR